MNHHSHKDARDKCHEHIPEEAFHRVTSFREAAPQRRYVSALKASRCADFPYFFAPDGGSAEGAGGNLFKPSIAESPRQSARANEVCISALFEILPFASGGLGAQPPGICADGAVASPRRKNPHKKSRAKPDFFLSRQTREARFFVSEEAKAEGRSIPALWGRSMRHPI